MNITHPRIATATAFLVVVEAIVPMIIAHDTAHDASSPAIRRCDVADDIDLLAERSRQGDAAATFEYARRIELGLGTRRDASLAAYWYQVAEEQGYTLPDDVIARLFP